MQHVKADPEDAREIMHAAQVIHNAIVQNSLPIAYVMEALQGLYASQAAQLVSYEVYCKNLEHHKEHYKHMWNIKSKKTS